MQVDRKNQERRRAAYEQASKMHERAAKAECDAVALIESVGETEKAARHRDLSEQQTKSAEEERDEPPSTPKTTRHERSEEPDNGKP